MFLFLAASIVLARPSKKFPLFSFSMATVAPCISITSSAVLRFISSIKNYFKIAQQILKNISLRIAENKKPCSDEQGVFSHVHSKFINALQSFLQNYLWVVHQLIYQLPGHF